MGKGKTENAIIEITKETVQNKIYTVRGQQVMLDSDLAEIYGYTTKRFNEQVKRNAEKFENDFMFQLTQIEVDNLRSQNATLNIDKTNEIVVDVVIDNISSRSQNATLNVRHRRGQNIKYLPYAFTEQGIYMLMTVLKGELATQQSKALIRLFKGMKDYIVENQGLIGTQTLAQLTAQNTRDIVEMKKEIENKLDQKADKKDIAALQSGLDKVMENFIDPDSYKHFLILDGQKIEAEIAYNKIYASAKQTVYVIDNYIFHYRHSRTLLAGIQWRWFSNSVFLRATQLQRRIQRRCA